MRLLLSPKNAQTPLMLLPNVTNMPLCLSGVIALVLYYRFLHPKSFEIFQSIRHRGIGGACMERGSTLSLEEKVTPTFHRHATLSGVFEILRPLSACLRVSSLS